MKAVFPSNDPDTTNITSDQDAEAEMELIKDIITGIRNIRGEMNIAPAASLKVMVHEKDAAKTSKIEKNNALIVNLAKLESFSITQPGEKPKTAATAVVGSATVFVFLEGIVDLSKEAARLEKDIGKIEKELASISKKLNNQGFISKAPEHVVQKVREKEKSLMEKQEKLQSNLSKIKEIGD